MFKTPFLLLKKSMKILANLFKAKEVNQSSDDLRQEEREGIVDLLLFAIYMDNHLSFAEDQVLKNKIDRMDWESATGVDLYVDMATNKVRRALGDSSLEEAFILSLKERITSEAAKQKALQALDALFYSDGVDPRETQFKDMIAATLA
jgi:hypothetical protein